MFPFVNPYPFRLGLCRQSALKYKDSLSGHATTRFTIHGSIQRHSSLTCKMQTVMGTETQKMLKKSEEYV